MKVLIDIAHPAHIHYFRNFAKKFEEKGHPCLFTIRDKGIIKDLADYYGITYRIRSRERKSKVIYMLSAFLNVFRIANKFKPDIFIDAGTVIAAPISWLMRKPYIALEDTEVATKALNLFKPFSEVILTPDCFYKDLGKKQIKFNGLLELFYLQEDSFSADISVLNNYVSEVKNYVLIRFVSWEAHHDVGKSGISFENKIKLIEHLEKKYEIVISSEGNLPDDFKKYRSNIPVHFMHQAMAGARFIITEGATMASEAVILGTPTIYINSIQNGYTNNQAELGLLYSISNDELLFQKLFELESLINNEEMMDQFTSKHKSYLEEKTNMTQFLVWFIEEFPKSKHLLLRDTNAYKNISI